MIQVFGANVGNSEWESVKGSVDACWMGKGPAVTEFENKFSQRINKDFIMVNNGSNALHLAMHLLDLPLNSEIIVPSFTWAACANAIVLAGHVPVFADVELSGNISKRTIAEVITKNTKAICVVHYAGKPVDMEGIKEFGIPIVEDAAHAVDSKIGSQYCGTIDEIGIFSFDPIKNLATPDAGGVAASVEKIEIARKLINCGVTSTGIESQQENWWECDVVSVFPKYVSNDIAASIALSQLDKLNDNQKKRRKIWDIYQSELFTSEDTAPNETHSYFTYLIRTKKRNDLAHYLRQNGIYTTLRFYPLHLTTAFSDLVHRSSFYGCNILKEQGLNLPLHPRLSLNDVDKIVELIKMMI